MSETPQARAALRDAKRLVVKVGSRTLASDPERFRSLADQIAEQRAQGRSVVLVSSGSVALGVQRLGLGARPRDIARLQAAAAAGQSRLMEAYETAFARHGLAVAQVLLTHADLADRDRYLNARATLESLLDLGAVPIINENDTVAVEEIRFGDNDQLAAMVAALLGVDLLTLLTDVEGLLDAEGQRVRVVTDVQQAVQLVRPQQDDVGVGGMASKLESVRLATRRGVPVVMTDAHDGRALARTLAGEDVGTLCMPQGLRMASRKHWIAFTLRPKGSVLVDAGAAEALSVRKRSLLPAGVVGVRGDFEPGDAVRIVGPEGTELARGLARYGIADVAKLAGAKTSEIERRIGRYGGDEIIHRDDMVEP
jgi:glutamate 5-kinase